MKFRCLRGSGSIFAGGLATGMVLFAGVAHGQITSTTTTTAPPVVTTTTTLPKKPKKPSPYSPATKACIKQATSNEKLCKLSAAKAGCTAQYHMDFANCFAAGTGVTCATACETAKTACDLAPLGVSKTCTKACKVTLVTALQGCAVGNVTCSTAAQTAYVGCKKACTKSPGITQCTTALAACLTKCPNL